MWLLPYDLEWHDGELPPRAVCTAWQGGETLQEPDGGRIAPLREFLEKGLAKGFERPIDYWQVALEIVAPERPLLEPQPRRRRFFPFRRSSTD